MRAAPIALLLLFTSACSLSGETSEPMVSPILTSEDARDSKTHAQPQVARVTHVALDLALDFEAKEVCGKALLDILAEQEGADTVILDSDGLRISAITDAEGNALPFEIGAHDEEIGEPVTITMGETRKIAIDYCSAPEAAALQWLSPEQTEGGEHPFLLSQGQAILNRTWIPTQDSPGIRQTWEARISAPEPLNVVMSGIRQGEPEDLGDRRAFRFEMDKPVPPYLIAIAAGDIAFRELGPRTGVWAEPATLDRAAAELSDTEAMVTAAEELYGPYRWGRYDMIVLPPAFPYGGMENPVMTFLTPTFIAGDRSLTGLVAHELAHSWSGNLVTNSNWRDSWLNEGVTSYFEGRITEEIYGKKRAEQEEALSFATVEEVLDRVGMRDPGTALHQPDDVESAGSEIIYDKGAAFLRTVERIVGRERFDAWLRSWFDRHAFQPATSQMLLEDMQQNLVRGDAALAEKLKLREWIFEPGLPDNVARPNPDAFAEVDAAVETYKAGGTIPTSAWAKWTSAERQRFLHGVPDERSAAQLAALDQALGLSQSGNNEELFLWLELAMQNRYEPAVPLVERFLSTVGRTKFVRPLFQALMDEGDWGRPIAKRIYAKTRAGYHAVTQAAVDKVVNGAG